MTLPNTLRLPCPHACGHDVTLYRVRGFEVHRLAARGGGQWRTAARCDGCRRPLNASHRAALVAEARRVAPFGESRGG